MTPKRLFAAILVFVFVSGSVAASPPQDRSEPVATTKRLAFYSDPWINLHHFLYQWSRADRGLGEGRQHVPVPERSEVDSLDSNARTEWESALAFYRDSVAARDHFDAAMLEMKQDLRNLEGASATPPDHIPGISEALAAAMPVYLKYWFPRHDAANRLWIESILPTLERHESDYVVLTERIFGSQWPNEPIRIDVSAYANWAAGYTATGHTVIYSTDPGNQGWYALETLFHELQHTRAIGGPGREALYAAFEQAGSEVPSNLWHALIFQTAGQFVESVAYDEGRYEHLPYWDREGFGSFRGWREVIPVVKAIWGPVVDGVETPENAYQEFVRSRSGR